MKLWMPSRLLVEKNKPLKSKRKLLKTDSRSMTNSQNKSKTYLKNNKD